MKHECSTHPGMTHAMWQAYLANLRAAVNRYPTKH